MDRESENKKEELRNKIKELLSNMSLDELSYTLGRYCGPSNIMLCEKKYGFVIPKDMVEKELETRAIEDILFA